jgi:hypothetical protein
VYGPDLVDISNIPSSWTITKVQRKVRTPTVHEESSRKLGFSSRATTKLLGSLFEIGAIDVEARMTLQNLEIQTEKEKALFRLICKMPTKPVTDLHITVCCCGAEFSGVVQNCRDLDISKPITVLGHGKARNHIEKIKGFTMKVLEDPERSKQINIPNALGVHIVSFLSKYFYDFIDSGFGQSLALRISSIENGLVLQKYILQEFSLRFTRALNQVPAPTIPIPTPTASTVSTFVYIIDEKKYHVRSTRYGPVIEKEGKQFISLQGFLNITGLSLDQISKSDVAFLISFPRPTKDGKFTINYGRYGFYISTPFTNISIPSTWYAQNSVYDVADYLVGGITGSM